MWLLEKGRENLKGGKNCLVVVVVDSLIDKVALPGFVVVHLLVQFVTMTRSSLFHTYTAAETRRASRPAKQTHLSQLQSAQQRIARASCIPSIVDLYRILIEAAVALPIKLNTPRMASKSFAHLGLGLAGENEVGDMLGRLCGLWRRAGGGGEDG